MSERLPEGDPGSSWWSAKVLARVWEVLGARLEARGLEASGRVRVDTVSGAERPALSDLLGRPVTQDRVIVDLAALDERLRQRSSLGLVEVAERVLGRALVDGPVRQTEWSERRESPYGAAHAWLEIHPALRVGWVDEWLVGLRRDGVLTRTSEPDALVVRPLELLWDRRARLLGDEHAGDPVTRSVLAARLVGDA